VKSIEKPHRCGLVESADIGFSLFRPNDPLQAGSR
jgi:hypothetical protein